MSNKKHMIHAASIGSTQLPGVSGQGVEVSAETTVAARAGDNHARGHFSYRGRVALSLRTRALYTLLSKLTLDTLSPNCDLAGAGTSITARFGSCLANDEGFDSGSNHIDYLFNRGRAWLASLEEGEGAIVSASLAGLPTSATGAADDLPYTRDGSAALAALPDSRELYRTASITVGGTALERWDPWSLSFDPKAMPLESPSDYWPRGVMLGDGLVEQVLSIRSEELDVVYSKAGDTGAEVTVVIVLKSLGRNGVFGASNTITITCIGTLAPARPTGDAFQAAGDAYELRTRFDGTNLPTTIVLGA